MNFPAEVLKIRTSRELAFSADGTKLAVAGGQVVVWDLVRRAKQSYKLFPNPSSVDFSPDGQCLVAKNTTGRLTILNLNDGTSVALRKKGVCEGSGPLFSPDGKFVIDGSWDGVLSVLEVDGNAARNNQYPNAMVRMLSTTRDRQQFAWDITPKATLPDKPPDPSWIAVSPWPPIEKPARLLSRRFQWLHRLALSGCGQNLAVISGMKPTLEIIRLDDEVIVSRCEIECHGTAYRVAWSPYDDLIAVVEDHRVTLRDSATLTLVNEQPAKYACDVQFSPEGDTLAIGAWGSGFVIPLARFGR